MQRTKSVRPYWQKRTLTLRFRITPEEYTTIQLAAAVDGADLAEELKKRGLDVGPSISLDNPSEWARVITLSAAEKRLRDRGLVTPAQKRIDEEKAAAQAQLKRGKLPQGGMRRGG